MLGENLIRHTGNHPGNHTGNHHGNHHGEVARMNIALALATAINRLTDLVGRTVMWAILLAILISAGNALSRKFFSLSSNAWLEAQWYLYGAAFLLAAAQTLQQNEHIRIDIVYGLFSRRVQHWIDLAGHALFLMPFTLLMLYFLWPYATKSIRSGELSSNSGGLPLWPAKTLLLVGFVLLALQGVAEIIRKIAVMRGAIPDPHPFVTAQEAATAEAEALIEDITK